MLRPYGTIAIRGVLLLSGLTLLFSLALFITTNEEAAAFVIGLGTLGMIVTAYVSGLNLIIPFPGSAFIPTFAAAGFSLTHIIAAMMIGTVLADCTGYLIGRYGRSITSIQKNPFYCRIKKISDTHHNRIPFLLFFYIALVPLPNELAVIPLALLGHRLVALLPSLVLGTMVNLTLYGLGFTNAFAVIQKTIFP